MPSIIPIAALNVAAAFLVAGLFAHLGIRHGDGHAKKWAACWALLGLSQAFVVNDLVGRPVPFVHNLMPLLTVASTLFLVAGTRAFLGRPYTHGWTVAAAAGGAVTGALDAAGVDPYLATIPAIAVLVSAIVMTAAALARQPSRSYLIPAAAMFAWGLNNLSYPFIAPFEAAAPVGTTLSAFFQVATGVGLLLVYLEKTQDALAAAARTERALVEHASIAIFRVDDDGRFLFTNGAMLQILGRSDADELARPGAFPSLFACAEEHDRIRAALRDEEVTELTTSWLRSDGLQRRVRLRGRQAEDRGVICLEGFALDVTEPLLQAEQLETARRLQAVGRLTGGIAHDFNNLLMVIQGNLELLEAGEDAEMLTDAREATERASALTRQLLGFARSQEDDAGFVDLVAHVDVLARLLQRTLPENVELRVEHEQPTCVGAVAGSELDQVVLNLVVNARDALAHRPGTITVRTRTENTESGRRAILEVGDDGPGIAPELVDRIFQPFVSSRALGEGSGLGLSIVKEIVDGVNGSIEVTTAEGQGATFAVRFAATQRISHAPASGPSPLDPGRGVILVVDDELAVCRTVSRLLRHHGYEVDTAHGVQDALQKLRRSLACVVSDVVMGDGNGVELWQAIQERDWALPCVLMSGYPDQVLSEHPGLAVPLLAKPFLIDELLLAVEAAIEDASDGRDVSTGSPPPS